MGRPRKDSNAARVRERIIEQFWGLLEENRMERISISQVAKAAGCNRGTIYYHFNDLDDIFYQALHEELVEDTSFPREICYLIGGVPGYSVRNILESPHFKRLRLVFNHGGFERAYSLLYRIVTENWTALLHPDGRALSMHAETVISFAIGGIVSMVVNYFKHYPDGSAPDAVVEDATSFMQDNAENLLKQISRSEGFEPDELRERLIEAYELDAGGIAPQGTCPQTQPLRSSS